MKEELSYAKSGVDYSALDPVKILAQRLAGTTSYNLESYGMREVPESRGESVYVWEEPDRCGASVGEGLGTKNLVADIMSGVTGKTYYGSIAYDAVAAAVNDLVTVGAMPAVVGAHWVAGDSNWFRDIERAQYLCKGWADACKYSGAVWGPGETATLRNIVNPETIELSASCVGYVKPKENLTLNRKILPGDVILLAESSGVHTNGLSLLHNLSAKLKDGYATEMPNGKMFGEEILTPSWIYVPLVRLFLENGIDIHYMTHITGHGWRKLMRSRQELTYVIEKVPRELPVFDYIQKVGEFSDRQMYETFNMGAGFAFILPQDQASHALAIWKLSSQPLPRLYVAGYVENGSRRVIIEPKGIAFEAESLKIR